MDKKVIKNYFYNLIYQILLVITPLVTTPYVSRVLHADGVGIFSYTSTLAAAFGLFAALGINVYGQKEIAYRQDDIYERSKVFWEIFILRATVTLAVTVAYLAFSFLYKEYSIYLLQQVFSVIGILFDISWFFQGIEKFKVITIRNIIVKLVSVALLFIIVKSEEHIGRYILICSLSTFVSYILFFINLKKDVVKVPRSELNIKRHFKGNIEFFIPLIAVQLYSQLDKIMLGAITGSDAQNGYYEQARKIITIVIAVVTSVNSVMYPRIANLYAKKETLKIKEMYATAYRIILMLTLPMAVGLFMISDNFVVWFFGADFSPAIILLKLSSILFVFMGIGNFVGMQYLSPMGKQNNMTIVYSISAVINIVLNAILIKNYLAVGAMIASVIAEAFACFAQIWLLEKSEYRFNMLNGIWKYVISTMTMGIVIYLFQMFIPMSGALETVLELIIGILSYAVMLIFVREQNVVSIIKKIISKVKINGNKA